MGITTGARRFGPRRGLALAAIVALAAAGLSGCRTMPATGRYSTEQYTDAQVQVLSNRLYGTAPDRTGALVSLRMDLYLPPGDGPSPRPTIIMVHGGGFQTGDKANTAAAARSYARRGYVAASINYRLDPGADPDVDLVRYVQAATNAIDDGMEAVRWLRSQAATFGIDTTRIAALGTSAGGGVTLGISMADDPTPGGPLTAYSPKVAAVVSTGAQLSLGLDTGVVTVESTDAPALMFHHELDTVTGATNAVAWQTCGALKTAGSACTLIVQPGPGHTVSLSSSGPYWTTDIGTFLWTHLRLFP